MTFTYGKITTTSFNANGVEISGFGWDTVTDTAFGGDILASPDGTDRSDAMTGTALENVLVGLGGRDVLMGVAGNVMLRGGFGG